MHTRHIGRLGYQYNQGVHALNTIAYYLKRNEADSRDALDALEHIIEKLNAADERGRAVCEQLNSLVGKFFGYELFKLSKYFDSRILRTLRITQKTFRQ